MKDSDRQLNIDLAQSAEHWHDDQELLGSIPALILIFGCHLLIVFDSKLVQNAAYFDKLNKKFLCKQSYIKF